MKRGLGILLALLLALSLLPTQASAATVITSAEITVDPPVVGASPDYTAVVPAGAPYYVDAFSHENIRNDVEWKDVTADAWLLPDSAVFEPGHQYKVCVYLTARTDYTFSFRLAATLNGQTAATGKGGNQMMVYYTFPALEERSCTVTFSANGGGGTMASQTVAHGAGFLLPSVGFTPPGGMQFDCWDIGGTKYSAGESITVTSDLELRATWKELCTITILSGTGGRASASAASAAAGTEVTLTAVPDSGYQFREWQVLSGGVTVTEGKFTVGSADVELRAVFEQTRLVGGTVSGNAITYTLEGVPSGAMLIAARYDGDRMTWVRTVPSPEPTGTLRAGGSGGRFRLFLLDESSLRPLCPAWSS